MSERRTKPSRFEWMKRETLVRLRALAPTESPHQRLYRETYEAFVKHNPEVKPLLEVNLKP